MISTSIPIPLSSFSSLLASHPQPEPSNFQLVLVIINLATCVPVWMMVGVFSIYHVYCAAGNSTTIEGWEKDRVATMVRRGKIREVKYPYVSPV
jgi:hypothetical protein